MRPRVTPEGMDGSAVQTTPRNIAGIFAMLATMIAMITLIIWEELPTKAALVEEIMEDKEAAIPLLRASHLLGLPMWSLVTRIAVIDGVTERLRRGLTPGDPPVTSAHTLLRLPLAGISLKAMELPQTVPLLVRSPTNLTEAVEVRVITTITVTAEDDRTASLSTHDATWTPTTSG